MTRRLVISLSLLLLPAFAVAANAGEGVVSLSAAVSTEAPYQNQSILYTVRMVSRAGLSNTSLAEIVVPNAIVEREGEPQTRQAIEGGVPVILGEFHFIITPLRPGPVTIPPAVLQGDIVTSDGTAQAEGLMVGLARAMKAISALAGGESFNVTSNKIVLNVRSPVAGNTPWLPLSSLKISEDISAAQSVHAGDLITRKLTLSASGAVGSQLPDLEEQQDHKDFKIYADKPVIGQKIDKTGEILGWRTESFSLVPQRPGTIVLPAIKVSWWNVDTDTISTTELPGRTIVILPGGTPRDPANDNVQQARDAGIKPRYAATVSSWWSNGFESFGSGHIKALAVVLIVGLLSAIFWWLHWRLKISSARNGNGSPVLAAKPWSRRSRFDSQAAAALKRVRGPEELRVFLQVYAHKHWGAARNASLEGAFAARKVLRAGDEADDIDAIIEGVSAALYFGRPVDIEDLKRRCRRVIAASKSKRTSRGAGHQELTSLNPD